MNITSIKAIFRMSLVASFFSLILLLLASFEVWKLNSRSIVSPPEAKIFALLTAYHCDLITFSILFLTGSIVTTSTKFADRTDLLASALAGLIIYISYPPIIFALLQGADFRLGGMFTMSPRYLIFPAVAATGSSLNYLCKILGRITLMHPMILQPSPNHAMQRMPHVCHVSCLGRSRATHESSLILRSLGDYTHFPRITWGFSSN